MKIPGCSPTEFVDRARDVLSETAFDDIVSVWLEQSILVVRFSKLGTTELRYSLEEDGGGLSGELTRTRVAPLHAPFRAGFEQRFAEIITRLGGTVD